MLRDPGVIACDMIGHEVEEEGEASRVECSPRRGQAAVAAESLIDVIPVHAVGRRQNIGRRHIRERGSEVVPEVFIGRGNAQSLGTAFHTPMSHTACAPVAARRSHSADGTLPSVTAAP